MRFTYVVITAWVLVLVAPGVDAQGQREPDATVLEDGAECFEEIAVQPSAACAVLYAHFFHLSNTNPLTTQIPPDCQEDLTAGFTSFPTVEPLYDFNQLRWIVGPGRVDYNRSCQEPGLDWHQELAYNISLLETAPVRGYVYLSADADEYSNTGTDGPTDIGILPCLTVRMSVREGHGGDAPMLASGQVTKTVVTGIPLVPRIEEPCSGADGTITAEDVTEFAVTIPSEEIGLLPRTGSFQVRVDWWQHDVWGNQVAQREWNVHSGPEWRPRVVVPVKEPLRLERFDLWAWGGEPAVTAHLKSPWGSYDVNVSSMRLEVTDPYGALQPVDLPDPVLRYSLEHDGLVKPINTTWLFDPAEVDLPPGPYLLRFSGSNLQGTATVTAELPFSIPEQHDASGASLALLVLLGLGLLAWLPRRLSDPTART